MSETICGSPDQPLRIGDTEIECYVLDDGTHVLTQASFLRALGRHPKANTRRGNDHETLGWIGTRSSSGLPLTRGYGSVKLY